MDDPARQIEKTLEPQRETAEVASDLKRERMRFFVDELDTALIFLQLADSSEKRGHPEEENRQRAAAQTALENLEIPSRSKYKPG